MIEILKLKIHENGEISTYSVEYEPLILTQEGYKEGWTEITQGESMLQVKAEINGYKLDQAQILTLKAALNHFEVQLLKDSQLSDDKKNLVDEYLHQIVLIKSYLFDCET